MKLNIILSAALILPPFAYAAELSVEELELMNQKELCAIIEGYNKLEKDTPEKQPGYDQCRLRRNWTLQSTALVC